MLNAEVSEATGSETGRLGELYLRHADGAVRLAYLLTGDMSLAEDVVQDAFVRVAGRLMHLRDPGAFDAYLRRTVVNLSHSHFRRRRIERAYLQRAKHEAVTSSAFERPLEVRDEVWTALRTVTPRQRAALVLRFYEDLSERQVAQLLNCRPGTVKSLVSRGLETLRAELRGDER
jgi:RNA polymerase sigma-70 factor (sigma-E family)